MKEPLAFTVTAPEAGWVKLATLRVKPFGSLSLVSTPGAGTVMATSSSVVAESLVARGSSNTRTEARPGKLSVVRNVVSICVSFTKATRELVANPLRLGVA